MATATNHKGAVQVTHSAADEKLAANTGTTNSKQRSTKHEHTGSECVSVCCSVQQLYHQN